MSENIFSRRDVLRTIGSRLLVAAPLAAFAAMTWRYLAMPFKIRLERKVAVGLLNDLPQGGRVMREHGIALQRQGDAVQAVSLTCTHLGCTINRTGGGFVCPCHGSRFDAEGRVQGGPATRDLEKFAVEITGNRRVIVDLGQAAKKG